jgi:hypothetical protein
VRDAAGEVADRLHLFGLAQLRGEALALLLARTFSETSFTKPITRREDPATPASVPMRYAFTPTVVYSPSSRRKRYSSAMWESSPSTIIARRPRTRMRSSGCTRFHPLGERRKALARGAEHALRIAVPEDLALDGIEFVEEVAARADHRLVAVCARPRSRAPPPGARRAAPRRRAS